MKYLTLIPLLLTLACSSMPLKQDNRISKLQAKASENVRIEFIGKALYMNTPNTHVQFTLRTKLGLIAHSFDCYIDTEYQFLSDDFLDEYYICEDDAEIEARDKPKLTQPQAMLIVWRECGGTPSDHCLSKSISSLFYKLNDTAKDIVCNLETPDYTGFNTSKQCNEYRASKPEIVVKTEIKRQDGYLYFIDKSGNIARVKMYKGGSNE